MTTIELPALCDNCRFVFRSYVHVPMGANATISGTKTGPCPRCGSMGSVPDGFMQILDRTVRLFSGPDITKDVFETIGLAVEDLRAGHQAKAVAAVDAILEKNPKAGMLVKDWLGHGIAFAALMLSVAVAIKDWKEQPATNMTVENVVETTINHYYTHPPDFAMERPQICQDPVREPLFSERAQRKPAQKNRKQRRAEKAQERRNRR